MATSPLFFAAAAVFLAAVTTLTSQRRQLVVARVTNPRPNRPQGRFSPTEERQ